MKRSFFVFSLAVIVVLQSCGGNTSTNNASNSNTPSDPPMTGEFIYSKTCINCHQADGKGISKTYPPLAHSDFLVQKDNAITQVIAGKNGILVVNGEKYNNIMPPQILNDSEVAAVLNYVYSQWGNSGEKFTEQQVKAVRARIR